MRVAGEPFYRDLFRFSGRRRRGSYFNLILSIGILSSPIYVLFDHSGHLPLVQLSLAILTLPVAALSFVGVAQRCRDVGWSGWAALAILVPIIGTAVSIMLLFYPGTGGPNRYGPDPLATTDEAPAAIV